MIKKYLIRISSIICVLFLWQIASLVVNASLILPGPKEVLLALFSLCTKVPFWINLGWTILRCMVAFGISFMIGLALGVMCGQFSAVYEFFELPVSIVRSTPVVAFILIAMFWFKSGTVPVVIAIVMTLPVTITSVYSGFLQIDDKLLKMAKSFQLTSIQVLFKIKLPAVKNYIRNAMVQTFGLTWKVVAAGEVLCLPKSAIGTMLQRSQIHLESAEVLAITIVFVTLSFILEKFLKKLLQLFV